LDEVQKRQVRSHLSLRSYEYWSLSGVVVAVVVNGCLGGIVVEVDEDERAVGVVVCVGNGVVVVVVAVACWSDDAFVAFE
jgi:hypothetical protein